MSSDSYTPREQSHKQVDFSLSVLLATTFAAQPFQCYRNAWQAFILSPERFAQGHFIEGWFVIELEDQVVMNEHGWIEQSDGSIVDPSVVLLVSPTTPVFYFPGVSRTWKETEALEDQWFPHVRFDGLHGSDGLGHPAYQAAREAARSKVYALALDKQPPKAMQFLTACDPSEQCLLPGEAPLEDVVHDLHVAGGLPLDLRLSLAVMCEIGTQTGKCWYNARQALLQMPHRFFSANYVEGWLLEQWTDTIHVTEHGWIEMHGRIVDPTIVTEEPPLRLEYVPGFQVSWLEMQTLATKQLPLTRWSGQDYPTYRAACQEVLDRAEKLAWQTGLPLIPGPAGVTLIEQIGTSALIEQVFWDFPVPSVPSPRIVQLLNMCQGEGV